MKRIISILCTALLLLVPLTACRGAVPPPVPGTSPVSGSGAASQVQQLDTTAQSRVPGGRLTFHTVYPRAQAPRFFVYGIANAICPGACAGEFFWGEDGFFEDCGWARQGGNMPEKSF